MTVRTKGELVKFIESCDLYQDYYGGSVLDNLIENYLDDFFTEGYIAGTPRVWIDREEAEKTLPR